jgi:glyceraldehyde 3-phosphate dehydrogenase
MPLRIAINGFGRIGRTALRAGWDRKKIEFVAINDLSEPKILAHLLSYDSVFRKWGHSVKADSKHLIIDGKKIPVFAQRDPADLPWGDHKIDVVIESTGFFTDKDSAEKHVGAGAKKVVISAPSSDAPTFLMGVNHKTCKKTQSVVNNASCTTNSVAPVAQIVKEAFGIQKAMLTTIHSVTAGQNIVDGLLETHKPDLRRARAGFVNIVPTSTGAAKATARVIPSLANKFDGIAVRVPSIDVSLTDFTFLTQKRTNTDAVRKIFKTAAKSARWKNILAVTDEPLVSTDFIGTPYASVVDLEMIRVVDGDLVKVLAWYDNEWGYATMLLDLVEHVGRL